jgi:adenylate kinase
VAHSDKEQIKKVLLEADVIIYDALDNLQETEWALQFLADETDRFEKPKTFVAISTIMTWAKTKGDPDDPEAPFTEDDYRKRKPHPNFKDHATLEKLVVKHSKKEKFKGYVIAPGLVYHAGDSIFHHLIKAAWNNEPQLICYGDGTNIVPCIHLDDLITITIEVVESSPEAKYIVAVDESKSTMYEITKAIADSLSNGVVKKSTKENALMEKHISQSEYDLLTVNLRIDPLYIKEAGIELKYESGLIENLPQLIQEYKDCRGLWPLKIVMHGPPASGKTFYAQKVAAHYKIHYLDPEEVVQEAIANLEKRINGGAHTSEDGEEIDIEADKELLNELREEIKANNGKLPPSHFVGFVRDKLRSMPCRNQGYILDGYPTSTDEANELLKPLDDEGKDGGSIPIVDDQISPEFIFTIEASDSSIKQRIMKLPESALVNSKYSEEILVKRLEEFRKLNTDEVTVLNFFDELEVIPVTLQVDIVDSPQILNQIFEQVGQPRNYGPSQEQIAEELRAEEEKRVRAEEIASDERMKREHEEIERHKKVTAEWVFSLLIQQAKLEQVRKQEQDVLQVQSEPLRNYLIKYVMPTLTAGLVEVAKVRPEDPIDYLAEFLFKVIFIVM